LLETFLAAKEQIFICGAVLEEELAARVLEQRATVLQLVRTRRNGTWHWSANGSTGTSSMSGSSRLRALWVPAYPPESTSTSTGSTVRCSTSTVVCRSWRWFDQDPRFFRLGLLPTQDELERGLEGWIGRQREPARLPDLYCRSTMLER